MSTTTTLLADALLEHVDDTAVAEVLFARVSKTRLVSMKTDLTDESAFRHYKGDLNQATTVAMSTTSPDVLERYAKDPRVTVRRTVANNPNLGPTAARYLHTWGHNKRDMEILAGAVRRVSVEEALAPMATLSPGDMHSYPWDSLADCVRRDGSHEAYTLAKAAGLPRLDVLLVHDIYGDKVPGLTLSDYLEGLDTARHVGALASVAQKARRITAELALLLTIHHDSLSRYLREDTMCSSAREIEEDAIPVVLNSDLEGLWVSMAQCPLSAPLIHKLLDKRSAHVAEEFARQRQRSLTALMAEKVAVLMVGGSSPSHTAINLLENARTEFSSVTILSLLRLGDLPTTVKWLSGELPQLPREGEIRDLVAEPGRAFIQNRGYYGYSQRTNATTTMAVSHIAESLRYLLGPVLGKAWSAELVDALSEHFLALACSDQDVTAYLVKRLNKGLQSRPDLWEVAVTLASGWNGGLTELIEMAYFSKGEVPPVMEAPVIPVKRLPQGQQLELPSLF